MKKIAAIIMVILMLVNNVSAVSAYMVNPFYAIDSASEYGEIKESLDGDRNCMYFQWGRLARNDEGKIQFTEKMSFGISRYDIRTEYGVPYKLGNGTDSEYTVKAGDSLSSIAAKYGIPYNMLGEYNQITDLGKIQAGQKLKIPSIAYDTSSKEDYKQRYPDGKVLLSVFFDAVEYDDKKNSEIELLNMDENSWSENIVKPLMNMLDTVGFDGVVLDFEGFRDSFDDKLYSAGQRTGLREKYNKFLKYLRKCMGSKILTVIVHPTNVAGYFDGYDLAEIGSISDYTVLMAYDFQYFQKYVAGDNVPAALIGKIKDISPSSLNQPYIQPYGKVDEAVKGLLQSRVNPGKVLLGVNLVGIRWIKYAKNIDGKSYFYYELERPGLGEIEAAPAEEKYMDGTALASRSLTSDDISDAYKEALQENGDKVVSVEYQYESPQSLYLKYYNIVKTYGLAGITVWRIGKGSGRVWRSLTDMFVSEKFSLDPQPTPTFASPTEQTSATPDPTPSPAPVSSNARITMKIGSPYMNVNGAEREIDPGRATVPIIKSGRTLIPIRTVIESLGGYLEWDGAKSLVTISCDGTEIRLTINSKRIFVNGIGKDNDVAPEIINDRTYLPLRFLLENLGYKVEWDASTSTITIGN